MSFRRLTQVLKVDGTSAPYNEERIAEDIHRAALSAGFDNRHLADDLSSAVTRYLERHFEREVPTTSEIRRMVENVLYETGHAPIAEIFRQQNEPVPETSRVEASAADLFPGGPLVVEGSTRDEVRGWGRERITTALIKEAGLREDVAADVAARVEERVFALGRRRVATTLIRDLVNQELLARGYTARLQRQGILGMPKYDLGQILEPGVTDSDDLVRTIGETTLKQYALQELFSREVAEAHLEGRIDIHPLGQPLKVAWRGVDWESLPRAPGIESDDARALTAAIASAHRALEGQTVAVEALGLNRVYGKQDWNCGTGEAAHLLLHLESWIPGLDASGPERFGMEVLRVLRERKDRRERVIELSERSWEGAILREACAQAVEGAPTVWMLHRRGPALTSRFGSVPCVAQFATLNLPQTFLRNEADFYSEMDAVLALAVRAHLEKRRAMERFSSIPKEAVHAVAFAGLEDLVRLITGKSMGSDETSLKLGLRIVSYLDFRLREEAARSGLRLSLEGDPVPAASERFARIDGAMYSRATGGVRYRQGHQLESADPWACLAVESRFHTLVPSGAVGISAEGMEPSELQQILMRAWKETQAAQVFTA